jgi:serine/threonine protein kinase
VRWLSDATVEHLRSLSDWPDLSGTRYSIVQLIGEGGMGVVYVAHDKELQRQVALKVVKDPNFDANTVGLVPPTVSVRAAQRMLREARIIARLEHPGIVPVHDVGALADGRIYYVMKLVRGCRLDQYFDPSATITDRLRVFERVCETVAFAHAHRVVHRDLKPQNIMVGPFGEVVVLDWGVAKVLHNNASPEPDNDVESIAPIPATAAHDPDRTQTRRTEQGAVIGTPSYMSPEQARGETQLIDERTDVFALGAILFFLLTGKAPFEHGNIYRIRDLWAWPVESPRHLNKAAPRAVAAICLKSLSAAPNDRYQSATQLSEDISRHLAGHPTTAHRENIFERLERWTWKYRTYILLVLAYLTMRILFIVLRRP